MLRDKKYSKLGLFIVVLAMHNAIQSMDNDTDEEDITFYEKNFFKHEERLNKAIDEKIEQEYGEKREILESTLNSAPDDIKLILQFLIEPETLPDDVMDVMHYCGVRQTAA